MKIFRHGDLVLIETKKKKQNLVKSKSNIILEGEASNHYHRISNGATILKSKVEPTKENNYFLGMLEVESPSKLTHEEHGTIEIPPAFYDAFVQREYDPQEERRVID